MSTNRPTRSGRIPTISVLLPVLVLILAAAWIALALMATGRPPAGADRRTNSAPAASPSPQQLVHYQNDTFGFDYPAEWRVLDEGLRLMHYQSIPVVLGTSDPWEGLCRPDPTGGTRCGLGVVELAPGDIVVEFYTWDGPPVPDETAPASALVLPGGLRATVEDRPSGSRWQIYIPGWMHPLTVEALFAEPGNELRRGQIRAVVESLALSQPSD